MLYLKALICAATLGAVAHHGAARQKVAHSEARSAGFIVSMFSQSSTPTWAPAAKLQLHRFSKFVSNKYAIIFEHDNVFTLTVRLGVRVLLSN